MQHPKTRGGTTGSGTKPKNLVPKPVDHRRAPTSEKKRVTKAPELETQIARLQEELKKTKSQLIEAESCTKQARHEADEAKKELAAMTAKLDDLWACEESKIQELRKISQDRDRAWEAELKAVQKHLATAINENQKLNTRLERAAEAEAVQAKQAELVNEVISLRLQLSESVNAVEEVKIRLNESKEAESRAVERLESVKSSMEEEARKAEAVWVEELGATRAANTEMENELRRLKVQMEQWRKAAEVAATMVLGEVGCNGKFEESSDSFEFNAIAEKSNSGYLEYTEDEASIKKTSNMLKKFGVLLKIGQK
ncbi:putative interactor of constitutively active ROPs [Helianthus annuus]|uniref:Interactor of constitutive active ROPs n=1 Tax=Helianthus annuus TaxID=4232 RepID=A0A251VH62_HELAN|nr:interactor of constitutive active ROPs 2, chloroplastic isoform X2 [Helianthus annuus]KAF5819435.1 putative interactor of constitutive active ROPs [Helianthus annuus]KAJ0605583.1 putative interactor of constitutively active ROPs [Helianthus annuus]KAJ0616428.1 putative interactor of constitutively active ROPs [Helianthus annuus]KAJ0619598.1 putative interactor of constitutively active ROPs [Helianthus annuus]KAJ0778059.1 putative interactor of constitutively active ROPs [Helianthus annuus]